VPSTRWDGLRGFRPAAVTLLGPRPRRKEGSNGNTVSGLTSGPSRAAGNSGSLHYALREGVRDVL
jgi:hypothetical protein